MTKGKGLSPTKRVQIVTLFNELKLISELTISDEGNPALVDGADDVTSCDPPDGRKSKLRALQIISRIFQHFNSSCVQKFYGATHRKN
uniref:Uncharacterized protein n=1 Tax=Romanomermis culicivorax TaxID=13658 RepID=A0A915HYY3_ROMCU